jgi:hypothetical protein
MAQGDRRPAETRSWRKTLGGLWDRINQTQAAVPGPRPWYYHNWFLIPAFIFGWPILYVSLWPAWAVLIIRSPWHTGFITGTLSWAMLLAGGTMIVVRFREPDVNLLELAALIAPGLVVTGITQAHWSKHKSDYPIAKPEESPAAPVPGRPAQEPTTQRSRRRRRKGARNRR